MKKFYLLPHKVYSGLKVIFLSTIIMAVLMSCKKDEDGMFIHHDNSPMMVLLHAMVSSMDSLTLTNDPDHDFAMLMKVNHLGSIAMGELELAEGSDPYIQELAGQMIIYRNQEIAALDSFLIGHFPVVSESRFRQEAETVMAIMNNNADLQLLNGNTDHDFAILMIQHHMGAINLVDLKKTYGKIEALKAVSGLIKSRELQEIQDLQNWLLD
jgi:uncharacterized protein (DUF305 family)